MKKKWLILFFYWKLWDKLSDDVLLAACIYQDNVICLIAICKENHLNTMVRIWLNFWPRFFCEPTTGQKAMTFGEGQHYNTRISVLWWFWAMVIWIQISVCNRWQSILTITKGCAFWQDKGVLFQSRFDHVHEKWFSKNVYKMAEN